MRFRQPFWLTAATVVVAAFVGSLITQGWPWWETAVFAMAWILAALSVVEFVWRRLDTST